VCRRRSSATATAAVDPISTAAPTLSASAGWSKASPAISRHGASVVGFAFAHLLQPVE